MFIFFLIIGLFGYAYEWICKFLDIKLQNQIVADLFSAKGLSGIEMGFCYFFGAIVVPVMEELIFRGIILQSLKTKMKPWFAIILSSALFASMHISLSFFFLLFVMGVLLAYSLEKTKSMYVPISLHCCNNAIMLCITLLSR